MEKTFAKLAEEYARDIRESPDQNAQIRVVAREIKGLIYADGTNRGAPLSRIDKLLIADSIYGDLRAPKTASDATWTWIQKEADNKQYLALVNALKELL